jgi:hypothetical protein
MNPTEIEFAVRDLVANPYDPETFPYEFLGIHNASKMTVSRLKSGLTNAAKKPGDVLWKKHFFFQSAEPGVDVGAVADLLATDPLLAKHKPRFLLVTNGEQVHARDLQLDDTLNIDYAHLDERADFFLPLAGYERRAVVEEHPADIKAAKKLKKLYDAILAVNPTWTSGHHTHELNLLMTRLLFCFYAEKTGIFDTPKIFSNTLTQHTSEDGSEVAPLLDRLFRIMNIEDTKRSKTAPATDLKFPYVNGSLFEDTVEIPQFNRTARRQLLECGDLDWTTINPDIFGSMIQTIAQDGTRSDLGMHYTSVPNIIKVLQPLFLDDLHEAFEKAKDSVPKLEALLRRLANIRVFDPACGSGNFLIIAYKALRNLEIQIIERIANIAPKIPLRLSGVSLEHFYGVDVVDFAVETAKLSLWLAEHQMNTSFRDSFGSSRPTLPLGRITTVHCGNALRINWKSVCPPDAPGEIYICSNPPYIGSKFQSHQQKMDLKQITQRHALKIGQIDYIAGWFLLAAEYLAGSSATAAFVSTNSICQGEQVSSLWTLMFRLGVKISFAHTSFKWSNSASHVAGVSCVIIGFTSRPIDEAFQITDTRQLRVKAIGPYLIPDTNRTIITPRKTTLGSLPSMVRGNMPLDGGHLLLTLSERKHLIASDPASEQFIKPYIGADEYINSISRFCLWIPKDREEEARANPDIDRRLARVRQNRLASNDPGCNMFADAPYRFCRILDWGKPAVLVPNITSERRPVLTIGYISSEYIINAQAFAVYNPPQFLISVLSSRLHMLWARTVGGKLADRIHYGSNLIYNTFPFPNLSQNQQDILSEHSRTILRTRARYPGKSIAWLYNPETMPDALQIAHSENDLYIEEYIYGRVFRDDNHRLEHLLAAYAAMSVSEDKLFSSRVTTVSEAG